MRTSSPGYAAGYRYQRPRWRRTLVILIVIGALLAVIGVFAYNAYERFVGNLLAVPGCTAGTGANAIDLDFEQASDAAVIAGVAARMDLPARALTIAYATAFQESKLENLTYGDRDSVGIFQQRHSQGWGKSQAALKDPAYATGLFFAALVKVPNYRKIPVYQAAQAVQHSAGGYAYQQYAQTGAQLAKAYTSARAAVTCWYSPSASARLNLKGAEEGLAHTFGPTGQDGAVTRVTRSRSGDSDLFRTASGGGWTVANWLVTNASAYGITRVRYAGYLWTAGLKETSWQRAPAATAGGIVAS